MEEFDLIVEKFKNLDDKLAKKERGKKLVDFKNILELIKAKEVVEKPEVVDIHTSLRKVVEIMAKKNILEILVSTKDEIVGMITLSGLLRSLRERKDIVKLEVKTIMEKIVRIDKDDSLSKAILIMNIHKIPGIVVFDGDNMVGIITKSGVLKKISKIIFTRKEVEEEVIETKVDQLIDLLESGKEIAMNDLKKKLNISDEKIEEWLKILERQGVIKIEKSRFGRLKVKVKNVG